MCYPQSDATPTTPPSPMPSTPTGMPLVPQQLQFGTPSSSIPSESPTSSNSSQLTPQFHQIKLGRGSGHPCKTPQAPTYDDFPVGASQEDIEST